MQGRKKEERKWSNMMNMNMFKSFSARTVHSLDCKKPKGHLTDYSLCTQAFITPSDIRAVWNWIFSLLKGDKIGLGFIFMNLIMIGEIIFWLGHMRARGKEVGEVVTVWWRMMH